MENDEQTIRLRSILEELKAVYMTPAMMHSAAAAEWFKPQEMQEQYELLMRLSAITENALLFGQHARAVRYLTVLVAYLECYRNTADEICRKMCQKHGLPAKR